MTTVSFDLTSTAGRGEVLKEDLRTLEQQIGNLTATAQAAGPLPSLVAALQAAERRKSEILRTLTPAPPVVADAAKLQALIADWRDLFRSHVGIARQILAQLLDGERIVFTPWADDAGWDFVAPCTLDRIAIGVGTDTPQRLVAPRGT